MAAVSAGLLMYRRKAGRLEVLLVHPGGPFWKNKDAGAWSIPKGEADPAENLLETARREFAEELGFSPQIENLIDLGEIRQKSGKRVRAWAFEGDLDPDAIVSNTFSMQWPPKYGRTQTFPEVDRAAWLDPATARKKINPGQIPFLGALENLLAESGPNG
ncbi:MAG: NUDIX domain-containing protein [Desulfobacterales bacterium]|nr:NUDIX domain-containing protein [Desulfobacterales bacterium]MBS3754266.1 NUDIX domain-containing protein [Desulfobacterales bacterium]